MHDASMSAGLRWLPPVGYYKLKVSLKIGKDFMQVEGFNDSIVVVVETQQVALSLYLCICRLYGLSETRTTSKR